MCSRSRCYSSNRGNIILEFLEVIMNKSIAIWYLTVSCIMTRYPGTTFGRGWHSLGPSLGWRSVSYRKKKQDQPSAPHASTTPSFTYFPIHILNIFSVYEYEREIHPSSTWTTEHVHKHVSTQQKPVLIRALDHVGTCLMKLFWKRNMYRNCLDNFDQSHSHGLMQHNLSS